MLFALAVGVAASALIRRTIPAMAVTLIVYAAARIPIHWIRWHFAPLSTHVLTLPLSTLVANPAGSPQDVATAALPLNAWLHGLSVTGPSGHPISSNQGNFDLLRRFCPNLQVDAARTGVLHPGSCTARVEGLSIRETITYQSASHFWLIQAVESTVFVALAAALVVVAVRTVHRRRAT